MTWSRHRRKSPRSCDRCRRAAVWNLVRPGHRTEYACADHAVLLAQSYEIAPPVIT